MHSWLLPLLAAAASVAAAPAQNLSGAEPLAQVNGAVITDAEVEAGLAQSLSKLREQIYREKRMRLEALIDERLLAGEAAKRGVSADALIASEITAKAAPVSDADAAAFYEANKTRLKGDLAQWREKIRTFIGEQRATAARQAFVKTLREGAAVKVFLEPPPVFRATVNVSSAPVRGNPSAPVTIVEFSDFHCPFCRKVQPVLVQLLSKYPDRVRIVYKDLPLDNLHPQARAAAEAARCAADQGKFWEFHDKLYAAGPDGSPETLKRFAQDVAVDVERFEACRSTRQHRAAVEKDVREGGSLGITGTPGFFINGRFLSGAQPVEAFARIVDEELAAMPQPSAGR